MADGWIKLHRKIIETNGYFSEPFCRNMAWVDLLLLANHDTDYFRCRGVKVEVLRGQCGYSEPTLAKRWKWSKGKVRRFLNDLKNDSRIVLQKNNVTTLISITNYDTYQTSDTANGTANGPQTDPNKNVKNDKKKNIGAEAPPSYKQLTEKDFYDSIAKFKDQYPKDMLRSFYDYWREPSAAGKMRFQLEKTWSLNLRLKRWQSNGFDDKKKTEKPAPAAPPLQILKSV
jgi:hypothetical protein